MNAPAVPPAAADLAIWRGYIATHERLMSHLARELTRETGLSEADFQVLAAFRDVPGARLRALDLRRALQWEKSRLSHQLARMACRGLVERQPCVADARGADIVLTAAGREAGQRARVVREELLRAVVFDVLGPARMANLAEATTLLAERLAQAARDDPACQEALAELEAAAEGA